MSESTKEDWRELLSQVDGGLREFFDMELHLLKDVKILENRLYHVLTEIKEPLTAKHINILNLINFNNPNYPSIDDPYYSVNPLPPFNHLPIAEHNRFIMVGLQEAKSYLTACYLLIHLPLKRDDCFETAS